MTYTLRFSEKILLLNLFLYFTSCILLKDKTCFYFYVDLTQKLRHVFNFFRFDLKVKACFLL